MRREELRRLGDPNILWGRPDGCLKGLDGGFGLEHVEDEEPVRAFSGRMYQQALEWEIRGRLDARLASG